MKGENEMNNWNYANTALPSKEGEYLVLDEKENLYKCYFSTLTNTWILRVKVRAWADLPQFPESSREGIDLKNEEDLEQLLFDAAGNKGSVTRAYNVLMRNRFRYGNQLSNYQYLLSIPTEDIKYMRGAGGKTSKLILKAQELLRQRLNSDPNDHPEEEANV